MYYVGRRVRGLRFPRADGVAVVPAASILKLSASAPAVTLKKAELAGIILSRKVLTLSATPASVKSTVTGHVSPGTISSKEGFQSTVLRIKTGVSLEQVYRDAVSPGRGNQVTLSPECSHV
jgi:hypothetical protein